MPIMTGLSGNEMFCLHLKKMRAGDLVIGNSVFSMGFLGSLAAAGKGFIGGEIQQITSIIHEGRLIAYQRMVHEAQQRGGIGITGVSNELLTFHGNSEFLSVASCVHNEDGTPEQLRFTTSANGQELYCQMDAGFTPMKFCFGNVAYSIGAAGGIVGGLKSMARGEIKEFSDVFNRTRHMALQRICDDAVQAGANCVVGIETRTMRFQGAHEMLMLGTGSHHPAFAAPLAPTGASGTTLGYQGPPPLGPSAVSPGQPVTSDLTNEEMWNLVHMGYLPLKLVLGTAVYSLGVVGGIKAMLSSFSRGEVTDLTTLVYDAREHAIGLIRDEASAIGADDVVGIKTHIHEHGNLIEFMAIGTAVKKYSNLSTLTPTLPPQAIIKDKDTWVS